MRKFLIRAISGLIYAGVIIFCTLYGGWPLVVMAIAFAIICVCELDNMAYHFSRKTLPVFIYDIMGVLCLFWVLKWNYAIFTWIVLRLLRPIVDGKYSVKSNSYMNPANFGEGYCSLAFISMIVQPLLALFVFVMLWLNDSGAYIVGSLIGKHKLSPKISPNKTWEGFFGGVVIAFIGACLLYRFCPSLFGMENFGLGVWLLLAASACILGTAGDLLESKVKRIYGVKDSGNWIPGHGGLLDRVDSFLLAFPIIFIIYSIWLR